MSRKTFDKNRLPDWFSLTKYAGSKNFNIKSWADAVVIRHDIYSYLLNVFLLNNNYPFYLF